MSSDGCASGEVGATGLPNAPLTMRDRILAWRDRILTNPSFHRFVFSTPGLRRIGRGRSRELFDICAGFVYSQTLLACVRLGVLEALQAGPMTAADLAAKSQLAPEAAERLLLAACALRIVGKRSASGDGQARFGLGELGAALLANPGLREMIAHHADLYADLIDPVEMLQRGSGEGALARYWPYAGAPEPDALQPEQTLPYSSLMSTSLPAIAQEVLDAYPIGKHERLLDVGGGQGAFLREAGIAAPNLDLVLFDLPSVVANAEAQFASDALGARATIVGGDFKVQPLPPGADIVSLVRILLDHEDAVVVELLKSIARTIKPGGRLLIAEPMSSSRGGDRVTDAYFGIYLFAMGRGRPRSVDEVMAMLKAAGFTNAKLLFNKNPLLTRVVIADAPK